MLLLSLMRSILRVLHLVAELEEGIFYIVEPCWWGFAVPGCADGRHFSLFPLSLDNVNVEWQADLCRNEFER